MCLEKINFYHFTLCVYMIIVTVLWIMCVFSKAATKHIFQFAPQTFHKIWILLKHNNKTFIIILIYNNFYNNLACVNLSN